MDKIKELLKAMGSSEEFSTELVGIIESHISNSISSEKKRLQEDFDKKLTTVKTVCVEEVENEKARLSRGVQRFLTANLDAVKRAGAKQLANEGSESVNKLTAIKALVEGINVDEAKANKDLQATHSENKALKEQLAESKVAVATLANKVTKLTEISEKSILRQKSLETQLAEARKVKPVVQEGKTTPSKSIQTMNEDRIKKADPVTVVSKQEEPKANNESNQEIDQIAAAI